MRNAHIIVSGRVQGVSFRWFVKEKASDLGLAGTVKNLPDRTVEVWVEGKKANIDVLIMAIEQGNGYSRTDNMDIEWKEPDGRWNSFKIVF